MWQLIGAGTFDHTTDRLTIGSLDTELQNGYLTLRFNFSGQGSFRPLSFGIVEAIAGADGQGLPSAKVFPTTEPAIVSMGPVQWPRFNGRLSYRVRNYNRQWLRFELPGPSVSFLCYAWTTSGTSDPQATFREFVSRLGARFQPSQKRYGPRNAAPLERRD